MRREVRGTLVSLVLLRADRPAGRAVHQRRSRRLVHGHPEQMGDEAYADYRNAIHDPQTVHAMLEDYRAGLGIDRANDEADRSAERRIGCPVLLLWAARDDLEELYGDPLAIWRDWADDLRGRSIDCGHHIAEEAPAELTAELTAFFTEDHLDDQG